MRLVDGTRLLVCGSRTWAWHERSLSKRPTAEALLEARRLDRAEAEGMRVGLDALLDKGPIACVIHGAAAGADHRAGEWATARGIEVVEFAAEWRRFGKSAGPKRNRRMLDEGRPELVVAFRDVNVESIGTANMITQASNQGVPVLVYRNRPR